MGQFSQALKVDPAKAAQILAGIELAKRYGECKWQVGLTPADRTLPIVRYVPLFPRMFGIAFESYQQPPQSMRTDGTHSSSSFIARRTSFPNAWLVDTTVGMNAGCGGLVLARRAA